MEQSGMNLQLFAGSAGGEGGAGTGGPEAPDAATQDRKPGRSQEDLSQVQYGIQEQQPDPSTDDNSKQAHDDGAQQRASFEELIKGEYKEDADKWAQNLIQRRFKANKAQDEMNRKMQGVIDRVATRYGMDADNIDFDALYQKMDEDTSGLEDEALEKGLTVDALKQLRSLQAQNRQLQRETTAQAEERQRREFFSDLARQAAELHERGIDINLVQEMENPDFRAMVMPTSMRGSGLSVEQAYGALHYKDMLGAGMQAAIQRTKDEVSRSLQAGAARPMENGSRTAQAAQVRTDPSKFTKRDFDEINRRAERGEKIAF